LGDENSTIFIEEEYFQLIKIWVESITISTHDMGILQATIKKNRSNINMVVPVKALENSWELFSSKLLQNSKFHGIKPILNSSFQKQEKILNKMGKFNETIAELILITRFRMLCIDVR